LFRRLLITLGLQSKQACVLTVLREQALVIAVFENFTDLVLQKKSATRLPQ